ncbi:Caulimovirus viroplasmin-domain-containing protein, partial [Dichotomocladium elegans]
MWVSTPRLFQNPLLRCPQLNTSPSMPKVAARCYYAVRRGRQIGIYQTWAECKEHVHGFPNPAFRKFATREEAENFILSSDQGPSQQGQPYTKCAYSKDSTDSRVQKNHLPHAKIAEADEIVYTDGASSGNGKKGAKAGWGMYWGDGDRRS